MQRLNRLRLIQEELADRKKLVAQTQSIRQVYSDALAIIDGSSDSNGDQQAQGDIQPSIIPAITKDTQDLIKQYNNLMK